MSVISCGMIWYKSTIHKCAHISKFMYKYTDTHTPTEWNGRTYLSVTMHRVWSVFIKCVLLFSWFDCDSNFIYYSNWLDVYTIHAHLLFSCASSLLFLPFPPRILLLEDEIHSPLSKYISVYFRSPPRESSEKRKKERSPLTEFLRFQLICFHFSSFRASEMNGRKGQI